MCMTTKSESPKIVPIRRVHELEPHVMPEPSNVISDFALFWRGIDWYSVITGLFAYISGIVCTVSLMILAAIYCGHADVVEHVLLAVWRVL